MCSSCLSLLIDERGVIFHRTLMKEVLSMRNIIIVACLLGSFTLFLQSAGVEESILLFLLAGIVPGTNFRISSTDALILTILVATCIIGYIVVTQIIHRISIDRLARTQYIVTKNGTVRRRYSNV